MSDRNDKFVFDGNIYERNTDGTENKVITSDVSTDGGIVDINVSEEDQSITITTAGLSVNSDGLLCAAFYEDEEV